MSIGTRGDMEPFLAIGELLMEKGHEVICAFPDQFGYLAEQCGLGFDGLGSRYIETLESDAGMAAMGGKATGLRKFAAYLKLAGKQNKANREMVLRQYEIVNKVNPDRILYNSKAIYPLIWGLNHPGRNILICLLPYMHFTKDQSHILFHRNLGPFLNRLSYSLAEMGMATTARISMRWLKIREQFPRRILKNALRTQPAIYTVSPSLFPRPEYWPQNLQVLGFHEGKAPREKKTQIPPRPASGQGLPQDLEDFIRKHGKVLFITFGSMGNPEPEKKTKIITDILERNRIPAIINTGGRGLAQPQHYDRDLIFFTDQVSYQMVFPRVHAVIHHGGSGTTHLALKYGCPSMIVPHILDQFVWNRILSGLGAGPQGVRIGKISRKNLEPKILNLVNDPSYRKQAEHIAEKMKKEHLREDLYRTIISKPTQ